MSTRDLSLVFSGAIMLGYAVAALIFLRFWRRTRERLFVWFALAFAILAAERALLLAPGAWTHEPAVYCTRLVAFLMLAGAIWDQNRTRR
jgi:uncharacterized membrane protein YeiB